MKMIVLKNAFDDAHDWLDGLQEKRAKQSIKAIFIAGALVGGGIFGRLAYKDAIEKAKPSPALSAALPTVAGGFVSGLLGVSLLDFVAPAIPHAITPAFIPGAIRRRRQQKAAGSQATPSP